MGSRFWRRGGGAARRVKFPVKVHAAAATICFFFAHEHKKEARRSTSGVHGVSALALTLGIGFMCEHAEVFFLCVCVCVCLRREIHQK